MKTSPLEDRFWAKVRKGPKCWEWTGGKSSAGYGLIGEGPGSRKLLYAHRLSLSMATGQTFGTSDVIMHMCDNPACVNPNHLMVGTQADNMADAKQKGRTKKKSKRQPKEIRDMYNEGGWTMQQLADKYNVCIATVHKYVHME